MHLWACTLAPKQKDQKESVFIARVKTNVFVKVFISGRLALCPVLVNQHVMSPTLRAVVSPCLHTVISSIKLRENFWKITKQRCAAHTRDLNIYESPVTIHFLGFFGLGDSNLFLHCVTMKTLYYFSLTSAEKRKWVSFPVFFLYLLKSNFDPF